MKKWLNINPKSIKYVQAVFVFQINHYKYMYNTIHIHPNIFSSLFSAQGKKG